MSYFRNHYLDFRWQVGEESTQGFRRPQLGALHATAAHFSRADRPAIIVMPTGSGKTAVLSALPFVLRSTRALVLTPSRLVRDQITSELKHLKVLRRVGAIPESVPAPRVTDIRHRIESAAEWEKLSNFDFVVGIPQGLMSASGLEPIPEGLFDLILVDEAHHAPARTWTTLTAAIANARQALFTATPFRLDKREIIGDFVYHYELHDALLDGVFGRLNYEAVIPEADEDPDRALAAAVAVRYLDDRAAHYDHRIMVRTGAVKRTESLQHLYEEVGINLQVVTGSHSLRHVRRVVDKVRNAELDGVICVDMLGEGFDLPNLKVAAIHNPHKSLAVTLQFIGRFARTTGPGLGPATFLALASEMEIQGKRLYSQGATWQEIVPDLTGQRVQKEFATRQALGTFQTVSHSEGPEADLSLYSVVPYFHAKVFTCDGGDVQRPVTFPKPYSEVRADISIAERTALYVLRYIERPEWIHDDKFARQGYELAIIHYAGGFLFICSSVRTVDFYAAVASHFRDADGNGPRPLSVERLNRVLLDVENPEFYMVGMRSAGTGEGIESYRTITGTNVQDAIGESIGRTFRRGHWFGGGTSDGERITVGTSSSSKVWSNKRGQVPELVGWCDAIAQKLNSDRPVRTGRGIDHLPVGREVTALPPNIVRADWASGLYLSPVDLVWVAADGNRQVSILDCDLSIESQADDALTFRIENELVLWRGTFSYRTQSLVHAHSENTTDVFVGPTHAFSLERLLNERLPVFYTVDCGVLQGFSFFDPPEGALFDRNRIEIWDWNQLNADVCREYGPGNGRSIHDCVETFLMESAAHHVIYDHGTGEIADYLTLDTEDDRVRATLYHCKRSQERAAGSRLRDVSEVSSQAAKSVNWNSRRALLAAIERRMLRARGNSRFLRGELEQVRGMLMGDLRLSTRVVIVQPGLSQTALTDQAAAILGAADSLLFGQGFQRLAIIGSA